jgi:hypothetical protein
VLDKYRDRLRPQDLDPSYHLYEFVPLELKVLLEEATPEERETARDRARKRVEQHQRDEHEALEQALPDLMRLDRYERRAWARQLRAVQQFVEQGS